MQDSLPKKFTHEEIDKSHSSFFTRPFFLSLTIGLPFCLFKILFGIQFIRASGIYNQSIFLVPGIILIIWAGIDMMFNLVRAGYDLIGIPDKIEFCILAQLGRYLNASMVFLALDTLITFSIICAALWSGWIVHLNQIESILWYFATTLNLISLSLVILWNEIKRMVIE
ncbi:MAG: hypothetical protein GXY48_02435 [Methanomicrobiales archaeon]|nr:hypothetical protein [Methanomicrobiales archaeon]